MSSNEKIKCYHCGEDCGRHPVMFNDKPFCCNGCKTVYEILSDSDACEYYNIDEFPGSKSILAEIGNKYAYLDNEEIKKDILEFSDGGISKVKLFIPSIHCSSCIWLLENLHKFNSAIVFSSVNFVKKEVTITFKEEKISLRQVVELLSSINYIPQITSGTDNDKSKQKYSRNLIYKLGIAGFCFGNIMLFSFPDYIDPNGTMESNFRVSFGMINLILSLPVVFYAANNYFVSAVKGLRKKIINIDVPIALGIAVLFMRSAYEILSHTGTGYMDSLTGLVFFLLIGKWYQNKTYQALSFERDYKSYFPVAVTIIDEDDKEKSIPLKNIKIGDRIIVRNQELIPADSILLNGIANIDYSFVSGESTPVSKKIKDLIYAGGKQMGSSIELIVQKEVEQSYLTELWNQDINAPDQSSNLYTIIDKVSQYFTIIIIIIGLAAGLSWYFVDLVIALNAFTSVLIVACPCALALTIPFAFGSAMRIFGRKGFYLKKTEVIETLSKVDTIVFDKTGTLTNNDDFEIDLNSLNLDKNEIILMHSLVRHSTHPMSVAIYKNIGVEDIPVSEFSEQAALGISGIVNKKYIQLGSEEFVTGKKSTTSNIGAQTFVSIDNIQKGYILIKNKYREGLNDIISSLKNKYDLHLLSGDNDAELSALLPLFGQKNQLLFNQSPQDKLNYIKSLKRNGKIVLMIGDGLNDAGALAESDASITIADDIYHFSPACDAIMEAKQFKFLSDFIHFTNTSMRIVKVSFVISFLYNLIGIFFAAKGVLSPIIAAILMPISSVSVVAFVTLATFMLSKRQGIRDIQMLN